MREQDRKQPLTACRSARKLHPNSKGQVCHHQNFLFEEPDRYRTAARLLLEILFRPGPALFDACAFHNGDGDSEERRIAGTGASGFGLQHRWRLEIPRRASGQPARAVSIRAADPLSYSRRSKDITESRLSVRTAHTILEALRSLSKFEIENCFKVTAEGRTGT